MQYLIKTLRDIFSMGFDVIIPISGAIVAFVIALALFLIRFLTFRFHKRRFERRQRQAEIVQADASVSAQPETVLLAADTAPAALDTEGAATIAAPICADMAADAAGGSAAHIAPAAEEKTGAAPLTQACRTQPVMRLLPKNAGPRTPLASAKVCDAVVLELLTRAVASGVKAPPERVPEPIAEGFGEEMRAALLCHM